MEATSAPESLHFYEPTWWRLPNGKRIHRSHVIYITGDEVPDVLKPTYYFGGLPLTQQIYERVYASERVANEAPLMALTKRMLIADGNIEAYLMNEEDAEKKLQKLSYCRDNYGVFFKRPGDNVQQIDTSLTDFDALIMTQYQLVASIARMPATKLLKTQPKGFNATGEYEMKDYIQELQHLQDNQMKPLIERNNLLVEKSEFGYSYELEAKFNPVDMPTERELAEVRKIDADTDAVLINAGAISPEESRARIIADPNSGYNGLPAEMPHSDFMEENFLDNETVAGEQLFEEQPGQTLDEWNEEDHPRADNGQFGKGGGNAKEGVKNPNEEKEDISKFLEEEISGVKGYEAIQALMEKKKGFVKSAFHRDDMGDIALFWGDERRGLSHILKRRRDDNIDVSSFIDDLTDVVEKGEFVRTNEKGRYEIFYNKKMAVVEPQVKNGKITFLLTAFKRRKP